MSDSFVTLWTVACQTPLSLGFPRQEYWSGLLFLSPGDLPDPGIKLTSTLAGGFFITEPPGKPDIKVSGLISKETECRELCPLLILSLTQIADQIKVLSGNLYYSTVTQKKGRIERKCF